MVALLVVISATVACSTTRASLPPEIHAVTSRGITAHFGGERPPSGTPLEFGASALWFTFPNDRAVYVFKPSGELFFSDWRFDVFSPDGAHVLLLQDRYGPYHVIATGKLKDYLAGRTEPDHVVTKPTPPGEPALVHSGGHWVSATELQFSVACCGMSELIAYRLPAPAARALRVSTHSATCRDSRLPPRSSWPLDEDGEGHLRLEIDVDGDGLPDVLEATQSTGSGFGGTDVQLTFGGGGMQLKADESFDFTNITAINPVPKELLEPRHRTALAWIEEALFPRVCASPDPSLAWLLDPTRQLQWIEGPPRMPDFYAIRLPAGRVTGLSNAAAAGGVIDREGEVWLMYAGHAHLYPEGRASPVELARQGDRVLLGTAHGVILTDAERSQHAWIYVHEGGGDKLRHPSVIGARLQGDTAIITLRTPLADQGSPPTGQRASKTRQVRVNLTTGAATVNP